MGISVRKRIGFGKGQWLNLSKRGLSATKKIGRLTINSRGRFSVRLFKGVSYRGGCLLAIAIPLVTASAVGCALAMIASRLG